MARIFASIVILVTAFYGTQGFAARIASLNPGLTDIVLSLGLEDALVAVSDYCVLPDTLKLTRIGSELTPRTEALIVAEPTHILTSHSVMKKELPTHLEKSKLELPLYDPRHLKKLIQEGSTPKSHQIGSCSGAHFLEDFPSKKGPSSEDVQEISIIMEYKTKLKI